MRRAQNYRQVGETSMNKQSSRSHCIFTLKVQAKRKIGDGSVLEISGKLHCVDLAGSECAKSADLDKGNDDQQASRERERMNINRSLLTLGRVVSMLKEQSQGKKNKSVRIPYRDSKLTRILQESLGGRCKTCLIATVSPSITAIEESMSTLNYAQAANGIINKPVTSSLMTSQGSSIAIAGDKKSSVGDAGTVEHWHEMECRLQYMQSQVEEAQQALARKHLQQQELMEKAESAEAAWIASVAELKETQREKANLEKENEVCIAAKNQLSDRLEQSEQTLKETIAVLKATQETESRLTQEAQELLSILQKSTEEGEAMHQALMKNREDEVARRGATRSFRSSLLALLEESTCVLDAIMLTQKEHSAILCDSTLQNTNVQKIIIDQHSTMVDDLNKSMKAATASLREQMMGDGGILPTLHNTTREFDKKSNDLRTLTSGYRKETIAACAGLRKHLSDSAGMLKMMEAKYIESSTYLLETLEKDIMECKRNLSYMITSVADTLNVAQEQRRKSRQGFQDMIQNWRSKSIASVEETGKLSIDQGNHIKSILETFTIQSKRHHDVLNELSERQDYLKQQGTHHIGKLEQHHSLLDSQREILELSRQTADKLCQHVVANIMNGVQDLVKKEIAAISNHQDTTMMSLTLSNEQLAESNQELSGSFKETFDRLGLSNEILRDHSVALLKMDDKIVDVLKSAEANLEQIHSNCIHQEQETMYWADAINKEIAKSESVDHMQVEDITTSLKNQGKVNEDQLVSTILHKSCTGSSELVKICTDTIIFATTETVNTTADILEKGIEKELMSFDTAFNGLVNETNDQMIMHREKIEKIAILQLKGLEETSRNIEEQSTNLSISLAEQAQKVLEYEESVTRKCVSDEAIMKTHIDVCLAHNKRTKHSVSDFSLNVNAEERDPEVPARNVLLYSDKLSSTPADHIILQNLSSNSKGTLSDDSSDSPMLADESVDKACSKHNEANKTWSSASVLQEKTNNNRIRASEGEGEIQKRRVCHPSNASKTKRVRTNK